MSYFAFDAKVSVTFHVHAKDEATARGAVADTIEGLIEANVWHGDDGPRVFINSASLDGEAALVEIDGADS